jgi:WD40 repeat protein
VLDLAFSPDGSLVVHALSDGTLWVRRSVGGEIIARLAGHQDGILSVAFSPDGVLLASGSKDASVNVWRIDGQGDDWRFERVVQLMHTDWVNDLTFSPDSRFLAVAALRSNTYFWRVSDWQLLGESLDMRWRQALSLAFSPDGNYLAVGSGYGDLQLWRTQFP